MFQLQVIIEKLTPDLLTLPTTFHDVSVSSNPFLKTEMHQLGASGTDGLNVFLEGKIVLFSSVF